MAAQVVEARVKIQSRFKDYYDHISHVHGADPGCVYVREPFKTVDIDYSLDRARGHSVFDGRLIQRYIEDYHLEYVVAGSFVFPALVKYGKSSYDQDLGLQGYIDTTVKILTEAEYPEYLTPPHRYGDSSYVNLPQGERLHELIRAVGAPVFRIREAKHGWHKGKKDGIFIDKLVPVLKDIGFPAVVEAKVIWQDIYTTLTTVLRHDPDKAVPVQLANNARIEKAGFDLKSSFRHPVNAKTVR